MGRTPERHLFMAMPIPTSAGMGTHRRCASMRRINAYDHDVSACLLRDGEIAYGIEKERITRQKHAGGFFQEVVDYCLQAEGITLDDVDLVVRNCYVLPVEELEVRMIYQGDMLEREREQTAKSPLYLPKTSKVMTVSHHLAHAYSAFAPCPFD
ncbi:MAG: carbamoyltransferase N-terminal domain-containing protein, partial [Mycobacterium sp.]